MIMLASTLNHILILDIRIAKGYARQLDSNIFVEHTIATDEIYCPVVWRSVKVKMTAVLHLLTHFKAP